MRTVTLRQVLEPRNDIVHPRDNPSGGGIFVGLEHIEPHTGRRIGSLPIRLEDLTGRKARFYRGDIVYGYLRPYLNKVWVADFDGYCSVDQYVFAPKDGSNASFVATFMRSPTFLKRAPTDVSPGQLPRIRLDEVLSVALPSLGEDRQHEIGDLVTRQLRVTQLLREEVEGRQRTVATVRRETLDIGIPAVGTGPWPWCPLGEAAEFLDAKRQPVNETERRKRIASARGPLRPYFGANGQAGWIDDYLFDEPLVLLAEDGGAFGSEDRAIAYRVDGPCWVNNHAHVLRPRPGFDVDYLAHALAIRPDVGGLITGSTRGKLNRAIAETIPVPMPPIAEQRRIAAELRERLVTIDQMTRAIQAQLEAIEALPAALLRRAFEEIEAA